MSKIKLTFSTFSISLTEILTTCIRQRLGATVIAIDTKNLGAQCVIYFTTNAAYNFALAVVKDAVTKSKRKNSILNYFSYSSVWATHLNLGYEASTQNYISLGI